MHRPLDQSKESNWRFLAIDLKFFLKGEIRMDRDFEELWKLNMEIGLAETAGSKDYFDQKLASAFVLRRANPSRDAVNRADFLEGVKRSSQRTTEIESITRFGKERALVTCIVTMDGKKYHNIRLFVRHLGRDWRLLGWANEPLT
jgi:hypothetical protein